MKTKLKTEFSGEIPPDHIDKIMTPEYADEFKSIGENLVNGRNLKVLTHGIPSARNNLPNLIILATISTENCLFLEVKCSMKSVPGISLPEMAPQKISQERALRERWKF